jgi:hypothetical protein
MARDGSRGARGIRFDPSHDARSRAKIQTSQIINRLTSFINGEVMLQPHQVTAALGLLRKTMPDLSQVSGEIAVKRDITDMTTNELIAIASGRSSGSVEAESGDREPDSVH